MVRAYLVKRRRRINGKMQQARFWSIRYKLEGEERYRMHFLRVINRQVADTKLAEFIREIEREAAGIIAPKALRDGVGKGMTVHLADFASRFWAAIGCTSTTAVACWDG